jgi:NTE family protein
MSKALEHGLGLALGGGGARGLAHIPALEALDELGVRPARIAGTSIGAIFGAAYASGMSGAEIRAYTLDALSDPGRVVRKLMELRPRRFREVFRRGALTPTQFDAFRIVDLFLPGKVGADFSSLSIPLSVIATDFYSWRECELTEGPLRPAIAASIALPAIFRPVQINGRVMIDGGAVNPLPADRLADCAFIVAVDVVGGPAPRGGQEYPTALEAIFGTSQILMRSIVAAKLRHERVDILLRPEISQYRVLDFLKVRSVLKAADPIKDELKFCLESVLNPA